MAAKYTLKLRAIQVHPTWVHISVSRSRHRANPKPWTNPAKRAWRDLKKKIGARQARKHRQALRRQRATAADALKAAA